MAYFVRVLNDDTYCNLDRATALRVKRDHHSDGWVLLAHFAQRTNLIGEYATEVEAYDEAERLAEATR